jgi:hypothetical protein
VLKPTLQLLVGLAIALRCVALVLHGRRIWQANGLASEFRRELRRRGLSMATPGASVD